MQDEQISLGITEGDEYSAPILHETLPPSYEPTPNDPPWNSLNAFGTFLMSVVFLFVFSAIFVTLYALARGIEREQFAAFVMDPTSIIIQLISTLPAHLATLAFCWFVVTQKGSYPFFKTLGMKWGGFHLGYCILAVIGFYIVFGAAIYFFGPMESDLDRILRSSRTAVLITAFLAVFTAPIVEEVVHRGVLFSAFQRSFGAPLAIVITTVIFAGIHFPQYIESPLALGMITFLSLGLTLIRWKSGNLLPCIITHLIFNGVQAVILVAEPYLPKEVPAAEPVTGMLYLISRFF